MGNLRRRIEDAYHDDPSPEIEGQAAGSVERERDPEESVGRGPVVQPSRLQNEGNEWREI